MIWDRGVVKNWGVMDLVAQEPKERGNLRKQKEGGWVLKRRKQVGGGVEKLDSKAPTNQGYEKKKTRIGRNA